MFLSLCSWIETKYLVGIADKVKKMDINLSKLKIVWFVDNLQFPDGWMYNKNPINSSLIRTLKSNFIKKNIES